MTESVDSSADKKSRHPDQLLVVAQQQIPNSGHAAVTLVHAQLQKTWCSTASCMYMHACIHASRSLYQCALLEHIMLDAKPSHAYTCLCYNQESNLCTPRRTRLVRTVSISTFRCRVCVRSRSCSGKKSVASVRNEMVLVGSKRPTCSSWVDRSIERERPCSGDSPSIIA